VHKLLVLGQHRAAFMPIMLSPSIFFGGLQRTIKFMSGTFADFFFATAEQWVGGCRKTNFIAEN
jgi:hypothetical protein